MKRLLDAVIALSLFGILLGPAKATTAIAMTDANIIYSRDNWTFSGSTAITSVNGAYLKTIFNGTQVTLTTDTSNIGACTNFSIFFTQLDQDPWVTHSLSAGNPSFAMTSLENRKHSLQILLSSGAFCEAWTNSQAALQITGLVVDTGTTLTAPLRKTKNMLLIGDSLTLGGADVGYAPPIPGTANFFGSWAWALMNSVDAEVSMSAFGGVGATVPNTIGVPAMQTAYALITAGVSRTFSPCPDVTAIMLGANDNNNGVDPSTFQTGLSTITSGIISRCPSTRFLLMSTFGGQYAANVQAVATSIGSKATYLATAGWAGAGDSPDNSAAGHFYSYANLFLIAPHIVPVAQLLLNGGGSSVGGRINIGYLKSPLWIGRRRAFDLASAL